LDQERASDKKQKKEIKEAKPWESNITEKKKSGLLRPGKGGGKLLKLEKGRARVKDELRGPVAVWIERKAGEGDCTHIWKKYLVVTRNVANLPSNSLCRMRGMQHSRNKSEKKLVA